MTSLCEMIRMHRRACRRSRSVSCAGAAFDTGLDNHALLAERSPFDALVARRIDADRGNAEHRGDVPKTGIICDSRDRQRNNVEDFGEPQTRRDLNSPAVGGLPDRFRNGFDDVLLISMTQQIDFCFRSSGLPRTQLHVLVRRPMAQVRIGVRRDYNAGWSFIGIIGWLSRRLISARVDRGAQAGADKSKQSRDMFRYVDTCAGENPAGRRRPQKCHLRARKINAGGAAGMSTMRSRNRQRTGRRSVEIEIALACLRRHRNLRLNRVVPVSAATAP